MDDEIHFQVELSEAELRTLERAAAIRAVASLFEWFGDHIIHSAHSLATKTNRIASRMDSHIHEKIIPHEIDH